MSLCGTPKIILTPKSSVLRKFQLHINLYSAKFHTVLELAYTELKNTESELKMSTLQMHKTQFLIYQKLHCKKDIIIYDFSIKHSWVSKYSYDT